MDKLDLKELFRERFLDDLEEDKADADITTKTLFPDKRVVQAAVVAKEPGVFCGEVFLEGIKDLGVWPFKAMPLKEDGQSFSQGEHLIEAEGDLRILLGIERTLLNFLGHLCAVSTATRNFKEALGSENAKVLAIRKTLPGLRPVQHYAVLAGGGEINREDLASSILIKENHLAFIEISEALKMAKEKSVPVSIEIEREEQLDQVFEYTPSAILLDNMDATEVRACVEKIRTRYNKEVQIDISGGVNLQNVSSLSGLDIDSVSIGAITHSVTNIDLSMRIQ